MSAKRELEQSRVNIDRSKYDISMKTKFLKMLAYPNCKSDLPLRETKTACGEIREGIFDYIYSIGVLHHTRDTRKAFSVLPALLRKEGRISIWVYPNGTR